MPEHPPPAPDWVLGDDGHWKPPSYTTPGPGGAPPGPVSAPPSEPPAARRAPVGLAIAVAVLVVAVIAVGVVVATRGGSHDPALAGSTAVDDDPASTTEPPTTAAPTTTTLPATTTAPATTVAPTTVPPTTVPVPTIALPLVTPAWCPAVDGLAGPGPMGHDLVPTGLEGELGPADMCLYDDGATVAAMWAGRTVDDLEADDSALDNHRFDGNDGEYAYMYYDGETLLGCATYETADAVYGACGWLGAGDPLLVDLHQAIKDAVG